MASYETGPRSKGSLGYWLWGGVAALGVLTAAHKVEQDQVRRDVADALGVAPLTPAEQKEQDAGNAAFQREIDQATREMNTTYDGKPVAPEHQFHN